MPKKPLTDKFVASVKASNEVAQVDYFDKGYPALALRVGRRAKVWTFHHREQGELKRTKLGRYPEMTLAETREAWRMCRKALAEGTSITTSASGVTVESADRTVVRGLGSVTSGRTPSRPFDSIANPISCQHGRGVTLPAFKTWMRCRCWTALQHVGQAFRHGEFMQRFRCFSAGASSASSSSPTPCGQSRRKTSGGRRLASVC